MRFIAGVNFLNLEDGGTTPLCRFGQQLRDCSSSARYKNEIEDLESARETLMALRPVRFNWRESGESDIGLIAEEVAKVLPELITYNQEGEIAGVTYRHLTAVLAAVIQEQ